MGGIGDHPHRNERHSEFVGKNRGLKRFHIHGRGAGFPMETTLMGGVKHWICDSDDVAQFGAGETLGQTARPFDIGLDAPTLRHHARRDDPISRHQVRAQATGNAEAEDRGRAGGNSSLDGLGPEFHVSAAREHAHSRSRGDPGFCYQPRDDDQ